MVTLLLVTLTTIQGPDTTLLATAAARGREWAVQHPVAGARTYPAAQLQYRSALAAMDSGRWRDALMPLQAVSRIDSRNPAYKGDLGYVQARLDNWDAAADAFEQASQLMSSNPWYYVGLGLARAGQERWLEAGGMLALAANTDSAVINRAFIEQILAFYERANRTTSAFDWYRIGTQRHPDVSLWWLKLAQGAREGGDTATGFAAIQRYRQLEPNEPLGIATYAAYLFDRGHNDSAVAMATRIAADTTYRAFAISILWGAGTNAFRVRDYARASAILRQAQQHADSIMAPRIAYYLGFSDLNRAIGMLQAANQARDCDASRAADSVTTIAEQNLRLAVRVDSANVTRALTQNFPEVREGAQNMIRAYCQGAPRRRP